MAGCPRAAIYKSLHSGHVSRARARARSAHCSRATPPGGLQGMCNHVTGAWAPLCSHVAARDPAEPSVCVAIRVCMSGTPPGMRLWGRHE